MNPHHFLITQIWDVLNVNAHRMKSLLRNVQRCLNDVLLVEQLKSYQWGKNLTQKRWHGEDASSDTASWQTKKWSDCTKFQVFAWMITSSIRKNLNQLENYPKICSQIVLDIACTWHELVDQTFYGLSTNLQEQSQNGLRACDRRLARLVSYIHHTNDYRQYCHVSSTVQHCRLGLFLDSDLINGAVVEESQTHRQVFPRPWEIGVDVPLERRSWQFEGVHWQRLGHWFGDEKGDKRRHHHDRRALLEDVEHEPKCTFVEFMGRRQQKSLAWGRWLVCGDSNRFEWCEILRVTAWVQAASVTLRWSGCGCSRVWCTDNTSPYARMRTFSSLRVTFRTTHPVHMHWLKMFERFCVSL